MYRSSIPWRRYYVLGKNPLRGACQRIQMRALMAVRDYERAEAVGRRLIFLTGGGGKYTLGMTQLLPNPAVS